MPSVISLRYVELIILCVILVSATGPLVCVVIMRRHRQASMSSHPTTGPGLLLLLLLVGTRPIISLAPHLLS